jgi:hypothetical protein
MAVGLPYVTLLEGFFWGLLAFCLVCMIVGMMR